jgi:hypothetical protein
MFYEASRPPKEENAMLSLLWIVAVLFAVMWMFGFALHFGGGLIHLLIVLAVISVLARIIMGHRIA